PVSLLVSSHFFSYCSLALRDLHSFPTRRSSDLAKEQIIGAWMLVSVTSATDDGKEGEPFGPSPKGVIVFSNDGHFSLFQSRAEIDRKSTRLNSSHRTISYAVFCLKKKKKMNSFI